MNQKPWLSNYPKDTPHTIDPDEYASIPAVLEQTCRTYPRKPAFHNMGTTLTFQDLDKLTRQFAAYLQQQPKLAKGDRIALMMPNILQYPIALFGALRAGFVVVNLNPMCKARELEIQLKDSGAKAIIIYANAAHTLEKVVNNTGLEIILTTQIGDALKFPKSLLVNFVIARIKKLIPAYTLPNSVSFQSARRGSSSAAFQPVDIKPHDVALLQYTGGTTGAPKAAILTHRNIVANLLQLRAWFGPVLPKDAIAIAPLPFYHIFSLTAHCLFLSSMGNLNVLITNPKDIPGFVKELKKWKFALITGVNTLFKALSASDDFKQLDFSSLHLVVGGGAAVHKEVAEKWHEVTSCPIVEAYGLTEASPGVCANLTAQEAFSGYAGLPLPSTELKIVDEEDNEVAQGETGEIYVSGPQVTQGYWQQPEETRHAFTEDHFFKTGDIGRMTEKGFVQIVDRKKDMVIVSGFNVYPAEIESVVATHPKVLEVAVIGVANKRSGESLKMFIVKRDNSLNESELNTFCRENLTAYKVPRQVEFHTELPKSPVGKILKKDLR